jgi:membrane associated rhomboid family serine protease
MLTGAALGPEPNPNMLWPAARQAIILAPSMGAKRNIRAPDAVTTSAALVGVLFAILALEVVFGLPLRRYGIVPRTEAGLVGIAFSPLLHANLGHLLANAIPLFVLLALLLANREYHAYRTLAWIWGASGLGTWLIGRGHSVHIGASSLIFGIAAFLIAAGCRVGSWRSGAIAALVFALFGGIFYGVLPQAGPISWEGHLCGAIAGVWAATRL